MKELIEFIKDDFAGFVKLIFGAAATSAVVIVLLVMIMTCTGCEKAEDLQPPTNVELSVNLNGRTCGCVIEQTSPNMDYDCKYRGEGTLNGDSCEIVIWALQEGPYFPFLESFPIYLNGNPEGNVDWYTTYEGSNVVIHAEKY